MIRQPMETGIDRLIGGRNHHEGIILIDKKGGETSFNVVRRIRNNLNIRKVGHAGTLDPFATGLLIILLGRGTRLSSWLMAGEKRYLAVIRLGLETDSLDPTGRVVRTMPVPDFEKMEIGEKILEFVGDIEQVPPAFSAVNYRGRRAYKLAREGISVELKKRVVKIHSIKILSIELPEITLEICCSGGTYIRSLASDVGKRLGSVAYLSSLRRLSSGPFKVEDSLDSSRIESAASGGLLLERIISINDALPGMKESRIDIRTAEKVRRGQRPGWEEVAEGAGIPDTYEGFIKLVNRESLIAVMEIDRRPGEDRGWLKKMRIF